MSKTFLFQSIQFSQKVLYQTIQFSISIVFVYTQLNVKTVLLQRIQFSLRTASMSKTVPFLAFQFRIKKQFNYKIIQCSISTKFQCQKQFHCQQFSLAWERNLKVKTLLFQAIQITICTQISSIWPIDRTLLGAISPGQRGPGSDGNKRVLFEDSSKIGKRN